MAEQKVADRLKFEQSKHHKQILRSQIDEKVIDKIEIDQNPSQNYMNAYKNMYNDELSKTVLLHEEKKSKLRCINEEDKMMYKQGMREERPPMMDTTNMSASQLSKYGQRYVDYDEERTYKFQDHVKKNYDGGQAFFKAHDQHLQRKQNEATVTNQTLHGQLQLKQQQKQESEMRRQEENMAFNELKYHQLLQDQEKLQREKMGQQAFRSDIVKQMEQEREKRHRKSMFNYNNIARHNPITNPIEYHIDNPYILKEIQTSNSYKSHSMYQHPARP